MVIGDDWGNVVIPLVDRYPLTCLIFLGLHFTIALGLVNLILAVIVDKATEAREEDAKAIANLREHKQRQAKRSLVKLCMEMDVDKSGSLTLEELMDGFKHSRGFRSVLDVLDVDKEDLECVFRIMDQDRSGDVSYCEFVDLLYRMKTQNSKTLLMFIKHYVLELRSDVAQQLGLLKGDIMSNIKQNHEATAALKKSMSMLNDQDVELIDLEEDLDVAKEPPNPPVKSTGAVCGDLALVREVGKASDNTISSLDKAGPRKSRTVQLKRRRFSSNERKDQEDERPEVLAAWEPAGNEAQQPEFGSEDAAAKQTERAARPVVVQVAAPSVGSSLLTEKWSLREELDRLAQDIEVQLATVARRAEQQHAVLLQSLISAAAVAAEGAGSSINAGAAISTTGSVMGINGSSTGGSAEAMMPICSDELTGEEATAERLWNMAYPKPADMP